MTTRLFFIGVNHMYDAINVLQHDNLLLDIDKTIIYYGPPDLDFDMLGRLNDAGIDTTNFSVCQDVELINTTNYHTEFYKFGGWIAQQFIKLLAIDACSNEKILIQDCDAHLLKPYNFFDNTNAQPLVIPNETHSPGYYTYIEKILNISRQTQDCFVTEFMPITKQSWLNMIHRIEKLHNTNWFDAIYKIFDNDFTGKQIWFSEYELLGNWQLYENPNMSMFPQIRYESANWFDNPDTNVYNCYARK